MKASVKRKRKILRSFRSADLFRVGQRMANVLYNLSWQSGLSAGTKAIAKSLVDEWDSIKTR